MGWLLGLDYDGVNWTGKWIKGCVKTESGVWVVFSWMGSSFNLLAEYFVYFVE